MGVELSPQKWFDLLAGFNQGEMSSSEGTATVRCHVSFLICALQGAALFVLMHCQRPNLPGESDEFSLGRVCGQKSLRAFYAAATLDFVHTAVQQTRGAVRLRLPLLGLEDVLRAGSSEYILSFSAPYLEVRLIVCVMYNPVALQTDRATRLQVSYGLNVMFTFLHNGSALLAISQDVGSLAFACQFLCTSHFWPAGGRRNQQATSASLTTRRVNAQLHLECVSQGNTWDNLSFLATLHSELRQKPPNKTLSSHLTGFPSTSRSSAIKYLLFSWCRKNCA